MKKQQGAVLIVSLVILLITTLLGVAAMQGTGLEIKMAKNVEERQKVFQTAETALRRAEKNLENKSYTKANLDSDVCTTANVCFDSTCAGGLCFFGDSSDPDDEDCLVYSTAPPTYPVWHKSNALNVWSDSTKHITLADIQGTSFKYVVEFQCYISSNTGDVASGLGDAAYRITLLAIKDNINVMLQSTYGKRPGS